MAQGLKPHRHEYYLMKSQHYYDDERGCMVCKDTYDCMICGKLFHENCSLFLLIAYHKLKRKVATSGNTNKIKVFRL